MQPLGLVPVERSAAHQLERLELVAAVTGGERLEALPVASDELGELPCLPFMFDAAVERGARLTHPAAENVTVVFAVRPQRRAQLLAADRSAVQGEVDDQLEDRLAPDALCSEDLDGSKNAHLDRAASSFGRTVRGDSGVALVVVVGWGGVQCLLEQ